MDGLIWTGWGCKKNDVVVVWLCYKNFALSIQSDSRCLSGLNEVVAYTIGTVTVKVQRAEAKQTNREAKHLPTSASSLIEAVEMPLQNPLPHGRRRPRRPRGSRCERIGASGLPRGRSHWGMDMRLPRDCAGPLEWVSNTRHRRRRRRRGLWDGRELRLYVQKKQN